MGNAYDVMSHEWSNAIYKRVKAIKAGFRLSGALSTLHLSLWRDTAPRPLPHGGSLVMNFLPLKTTELNYFSINFPVSSNML